MKKLIIILCILITGCVSAPPRDTMYGLPGEIREAMAENKLLSGAGTRNSSAYRYGSPERGFLNINSNRGYTNSEYSGNDGHGWSLQTSSGRVTGWSIW